MVARNRQAEVERLSGGRRESRIVQAKTPVLASTGKDVKPCEPRLEAGKSARTWI